MSAPSFSTGSECFIDTNIWLYAFILGPQPNKHAIAKALIHRESQIALSVQVINEISVNLLKKAAFSEKDIRQLVDTLYQRFRVIPIDHSVLIRASHLRERYQISFWDGLIVSSALIGDATILYPEDMQNGLIVEERLTIVNPFVINTPQS